MSTVLAALALVAAVLLLAATVARVRTLRRWRRERPADEAWIADLIRWNAEDACDVSLGVPA